MQGIQESPRRYVRAATLAKQLDCNRSTIWRWSERGILPPPIKIGGTTVWDVDEVEEYVARAREVRR